MSRTRQYGPPVLGAVMLALLTILFVSAAPPTANASPALAPNFVSVPGSFNDEVGCPGDWQPECNNIQLTYDAGDDVWQGTLAIPGGSYEYKAALDKSWAVSYGLNGGSANIPLALGGNTNVKFYYDDKSHWITDNVNSVIAVAPGSFQSELGCPGDWQPDCLRSWLQDMDGDGIYTFETTALPAGNYEGKVAINENWNENYGEGGVQNGPNIQFNVPVNNAKVTFKYNATTHVPTISAGHSPDNNVEWDGLRHDSRDLLYRTPGGAAPTGTPVILRLRTFHNDVTGVKVRVYDVNASGQQINAMTLVASDVSCYQNDLAQDTCDYWAFTLPNADANNLWYRFIVTDGTKTAYYADDTAALDGGLGAPSNEQLDRSWALMVYNPGFTVPAWAETAVVYQIFPDRFYNANPDNDPQTGDLRYDDPVLAMQWGVKPEGFCRNYADGNTNCPWRYDDTPPADSPTKEQPRGRDYYGGDLYGVIQKLDYLKGIGVTAIYFNPVFEAKSNHRYDTANYNKIDPALGNSNEWNALVKQADARGIRIILDGVFNHQSSDSGRFDRYDHYAGKKGACENAKSKFRAWFTFRAPAGNEPAACKPSTAGGTDTFYVGWFGFDSIPVLNKALPAVQKMFIKGNKSIAAKWLDRGAAAWRMDVMGDSSFPNGYWETFRSTVKNTKSDALIIGELWQKDTTLLRFLRGDRADTTMNYRLRDAVLGYLTPQAFDAKGFADSGYQITPSQFAARLSSIREDYPDAAYFSLLNLLDSHDTERVLWALTPGTETTADKEDNAANVADGKSRMRLAALIQFTMPGMPTVYYGDEIAMTGDDDPDDRRTYPWGEDAADTQMRQYYKSLAELRDKNEALTEGDFQMLYVNDTEGTVAYGRKTDKRAVIVALNRSNTTRTVTIALDGFTPAGTTFDVAFSTPEGAAAPNNGNTLAVDVAPMSGVVLSTKNNIDLQAPNAPTNLHVTDEGSMQVTLAWDDVSGAAGYNVYRSPVSGGGHVKINGAPITSNRFNLADAVNGGTTDTGLNNATTYYYAVTALDTPGNESDYSNEASALPHYGIGWANTQWPPTITHTISAVNATENVYGQVWIDNATNQPGATQGLMAQLGFGPQGSNPDGNSAWTWVDATFNTDTGNNDEFKATLLPEQTGTFNYLYRYSTTNGRDWLYADFNGPITSGATPPNPGVLTVNPSGDTTAPAAPTNLNVTTFAPNNIGLAWDAVADATLYGYDVLRSDTAGGPYTKIGTTTNTTFDDASVSEGATYYYVVQAVDTSFNRSGNSNEVQATAQTRTVTVTFNVTVPTPTDGAIGRSVYIAGFLDRLDGGLPQWDPAGVVLTKVDDTHWTITLTGKEGVQIEYKYTLGSWDYVEKDNTCGEIANRQLTLTYGVDGNQTVNDTVPQWRNVAPCGN
ncbi:MAG: alpha-amylase [Chloroflexi bacterium]|nr:alpha-amylase [Chloroflexota bacterium]